MRRLCIAVCCLYLASTALADDDSQFVLDSVETKFAADISKALVEVTRAETELAKARKNAASARLKAYKEKLVEITKTGDFDKAQKVKARIDALEKDAEPDLQPVKKTAKIPKDAVKFGGHTYLLITEAAAWHVAKQRCEEMGGHLAIVTTEQEMNFLIDLGNSKQVKSAWIGATDEEKEGVWKWVDGTAAKISGPAIDNANGGEHFLAIMMSHRIFNDGATERAPYFCEWDR